MYTRCPYCHTYFKIMAEHLKKAGGQVRCGQCYKVFNSIGNLIEKLPVPLSQKGQTGSTAATKNVKVNKTGKTANNAAATAIHRKRVPGSTSASATPKPKTTNIPTTPVDGPHLRSNTPRKAAFSGKDSIESIILSKKDKITGVQDSSRSAAKGMIVYPSAGASDENQDHTDHQIAMKWGIGLLILLVIFVIQSSYFFRGDLAQHTVIRPWITTMCNIFNCTIPTKHDIRAIKLTRRDITTHPKVNNALLISAALVNEAQHTQPYPVMRIQLSDTIGQTLASRNFYPNEYLDADISLRKGMPPGTPIQINLEIIDPGKNAINFEFDFFYFQEL